MLQRFNKHEKGSPNIIIIIIIENKYDESCMGHCISDSANLQGKQYGTMNLFIEKRSVGCLLVQQIHKD